MVTSSRRLVLASSFVSTTLISPDLQHSPQQLTLDLSSQKPGSTLSTITTTHEQSTSSSIGGLLGALPPCELPINHNIPSTTVDSVLPTAPESEAFPTESVNAAPVLLKQAAPFKAPTYPSSSNPLPQTWDQRFKSTTDRSLSRLAPVTVSPSGKPRIKISDDVFRRGAGLHKEYIGGYFLGKPPSYHLIESVLSHIWGKCKKLEIHVDHGARSMLARLPNDYIRQKVLEKKFWHVDQSLFHVAQWGAYETGGSPLDCFLLWAHLKGVSFDLMTQEGLSIIAGLVGEHKEKDD